MQVKCSGTALIRHAVSGVEFEIRSTALLWRREIYHHRSMGPEWLYSATIQHPELGELKWEIWEYPEGTQNNKETLVGPHALIQDVDYSLESFDEDELNRVEEIVAWFHSHYEDPAERTPYESAEGGYQWIWGGPYDAREVVSDEFADEDDEIIEAAVEEIEADGILEWAPRETPADYDQTDDEWSATDEAIARALGNVPDQEAGVTFRAESDKIVLDWTASTKSDSAQIAELLPELREVASYLRNSLDGSNAHGALGQISERYCAAADKELVSIDQLYSVGVRLENARFQTNRAIEEGELPTLSAEAAEALDSVLALHGVIVGSTARGRELMDNAQAYAHLDFDIAVLRGAAHRLSSVVGEASTVFDREVRETLRGLNDEIGEGPQPQRSTKSALTANRNLFIVLGGTLGTVVFSHIVLPGVAASTPVVAAIDAVTSLTNVAWAFFVEHVGTLRHYAAVAGPDMRWALSLCELIERAKLRLLRQE